MTSSHQEINERREALRHLLREPLVTTKHNPEMFRLVVRHKAYLVTWFATHTGWTLSVERHGGFARLFKLPAADDTSHGATVSNKVFTTRHYTLFCLTLAALDDCGLQITLTRLADRLAELSVDTPQISKFDTDQITERRMFVDVLRWLVNHAILTPRDGDAERYASGADADALYDVDERLLGQLVAAPVAPSLAADAAAMRQEMAYAETDDGRRQWARHRVMRRLLDEPVVYFDELTPPERAWLEHSRGYVYGVLADDVGLSVERRLEGLACIDASGTLTDRLFPDAGSTLRHAALLLAEAWSERLKATAGASPVLDTDTIRDMLTALSAAQADRCNWTKAYREADGLARLTADTLAFLTSLKMVRQNGPALWEARPVMARFAVTAPPVRRTA